MPPRTTQKSHRPRVSDRTMVGNCHPLLASAKDAAGRTQKNMTPRTSHKGEKQNHALEKCIAAANRGWMSEKYLPPAGQEKCFFLTSPFIEPSGMKVGVFLKNEIVILSGAKDSRFRLLFATFNGAVGFSPLKRSKITRPLGPDRLRPLQAPLPLRLHVVNEQRAQLQIRPVELSGKRRIV